MLTACRYWELLEMIRKLLLASMIPMLISGADTQVRSATLCQLAPAFAQKIASASSQVHVEFELCGRPASDW